MTDFVYSDKRTVELPNGLMLEIEMTRTFVKMLMARYKLTNEHDLSDDLLREFMYGTLDAVNKEKSK